MIVVFCLLMASFVSGTKPISNYDIINLRFELCTEDIMPETKDWLMEGNILEAYQIIRVGNGKLNDYQLFCSKSLDPTKCNQCAEVALQERAEEIKITKEEARQNTIQNIIGWVMYFLFLGFTIFLLYKNFKWQTEHKVWKVIFIIILLLFLIFLLTIPLLRAIFAPMSNYVY